jgi:2-polyprenyl-3-methyl-5-hydroxy-6-metoxy-1,4-benzoquinol methylase
VFLRVSTKNYEDTALISVERPVVLDLKSPKSLRIKQMPLDPRLSRNYRDHTSETQRETYRQWADTYDQELLEEFGYRAPHAAVEHLLNIVPKRDSQILDMGCGTGIVGELLHVAGYREIDGLDLSPEMLAKAKERKVYRKLGEADLFADLSLTPEYDAVICVGVFSHGQSHPFDLARLFSALKPEGRVIATVNGKGWLELGWEKRLAESAQQHSFLVETIDDIPYLTLQGIPGKLLTARHAT